MQSSTDRHSALSGRELQRMMTRRLTRAAIIANGLGATVVFVFLAFINPLPIDPADDARLTVVNAIVFVVYMTATLPLGIALARRRNAGVWEWLASDRQAGERERAAVLRNPLDFALSSGAFWFAAAIVFTPINATVSGVLGLAVAVTIILGGVTTGAVGYLLVERILRPVTARALAIDPPTRPVAPGVTTRLTTAWVVATGVPLLGVTALAAAMLLADELERTTAAAATLSLALLGLGVGLLAIILAARSVADPVAAVRAALARVEKGNLDARVEVDDGSEIGLLQAGFNRMAIGLRERERLRDLFGRHVGRDVAQAALEGDAELGGEEREVAALFVDVVGSTALASERRPTEVVSLLNTFFRIVIEVVEKHGGLVNKFEGDAALCVFGAPVARPDPAGDALAAARTLRERLQRDLPAVDFGIGVSAGRAVAGNIGAEERFEYTVIGDPVNEAARLCELAKRRPERLLASHAAVERAGPAEGARWKLGEEVTLRGRGEATRLATVAEQAGRERGAAQPA
jgi:adenylate cyclase